MELKQYFHAKWSKELGANAFTMTRQRFPKAIVFWAASESMSIGVIEAATQAGLISGKDYVSGGVDLLPRNFNYLKSRQMDVSIGGHYMDGAWALVVLHDYLKGHDFFKQHGTTFSTQMITVSGQNIDEFGDLDRLMTPENVSRIDFTRYSKAYNPELISYQFPTEELLTQLGR